MIKTDTKSALTLILMFALGFMAGDLVNDLTYESPTKQMKQRQNRMEFQRYEYDQNMGQDEYYRNKREEMKRDGNRPSNLKQRNSA